MTDKSHPPSVLMLLSSGCAHCPGVLNHLTELLKKGEISKLEAININQQPDIARELNVRSVPWVKIGPIELTGSQSKADLVRAIEQASSANGLVSYFEDMLNNGQLQEAIEQLRKQPDNIPLLLEMLQNPEIQISVQIGIGAIMEDLAASPALIKLIPALTELTKNPLARIRNDACYYLSLTADPSVKDTISSLLNDSNDEVRETAKDCLQDLEEMQSDL